MGHSPRRFSAYAVYQIQHARIEMAEETGVEPAAPCEGARFPDEDRAPTPDGSSVEMVGEEGIEPPTVTMTPDLQSGTAYQQHDILPCESNEDGGKSGTRTLSARRRLIYSQIRFLLRSTFP